MVLKNKLLLYVCLLLFTMSLQAQYTTKDIETYIETYSDLAVKKWKTWHSCKHYFGTRYFGVGCRHKRLGSQCQQSFRNQMPCRMGRQTYFKDDDKKNECFRSYASVEDSYNDHSDILK